MVVRWLRLGPGTGPGSVGVAGLQPSAASTAAGDRTLLPRPGRPAWRGTARPLPCSFIKSSRPACTAKIVLMNETTPYAWPSLPTHNAGHSQIFNERVLHTHADTQTDRRRDARGGTHTRTKTTTSRHTASRRSRCPTVSLVKIRLAR